MPTIQLPFEAILEATEQLEPHQLEALSQRLGALKRNSKKLAMEREIQVLKQEFEHLTLSPSQWALYFQLVDARRSGTATQSNREEFLQLAAQAQDKANERLELIVGFATRHKISLPEAMRKLGVKKLEPVVI